MEVMRFKILNYLDSCYPMSQKRDMGHMADGEIVLSVEFGYAQETGTAN